jgi:hypothetical protein
MTQGTSDSPLGTPVPPDPAEAPDSTSDAADLGEPLADQTVDEVFERLRHISLDRADALRRAYEAIPPEDLDLPDRGPWVLARAEPPRLPEIEASRRRLRAEAVRAARAKGYQGDPDDLLHHASSFAVDSLAQARLGGGDLEGATFAAEMGARDAALAADLRPWLEPSVLRRLAGPWGQAFSGVGPAQRPFDILGAMAVFPGLLAVIWAIQAWSGEADWAPAAAFALGTGLIVAVRWRVRRLPLDDASSAST